MKKMIVLLVFLTGPLRLLSSSLDTAKWVCPKSAIQSVYEAKTHDDGIELLRLYKNGTYEHLKYSYDQHNGMSRNVGKYRIENKFLVLDPPSVHEFSANIYHKKLWVKKNLYGSFFSSILREKDFLFQKTAKKEYRAPFFINPLDGCIVHKKNAEKKIDLQALAIWLTSDCKTEKAKVENIHKFISKTLAYDHVGLANDHYANSQTDVPAMIAGTKRLAVCAGYSRCFEKLAKLSGLEVEYVVGDAKSTNEFEHTEHGCHAWNKVKADGKWYADDVTWDWLLVDPTVMIYSHFPDQEKDQMLDSTISKDKFNKAAIIYVQGSSKGVDFLPKEGMQFDVKEFEFKIKGNITEVSASCLNENYSNIIYTNEPEAGKSYNYTLLTAQRSLKGEYTCIKISLPDTVAILRISMKGIGEYYYKVSSLNETDYYKRAARIANNKNIDVYIKGIAACLKTNDTVQLKKLVSDTNKLFFDNKGRFILSKDLQRKFKDWNGLLSKWVASAEFAFKNGALIDQAPKNKIYFNTCDFFVFEKTANGYCVTQINDKKKQRTFKT